MIFQPQKQENYKMPDVALISDLTWRSLEMQRKHFSGMQCYVAPDEIQQMLRKTTRKERIHVHVISLGVIADNQNDFIDFWNLLQKRKAFLLIEPENDCILTSFEGAKLDDVIKYWRMARKNGVAKIGGQISAAKREDESKIAIAKIKDRWPLPNKEWATSVLLKEADLSYNTAIKFLGKRPIAQYNYQAKMKRKAAKDAKR